MPAGSAVSPSDVLDAAGDILDKSANLIAAAKTAVDDPDNPNSKAKLTQVITAFRLCVDICYKLCSSSSSCWGQPRL